METHYEKVSLPVFSQSLTIIFLKNGFVTGYVYMVTFAIKFKGPFIVIIIQILLLLLRPDTQKSTEFLFPQFLPSISSPHLSPCLPFELSAGPRARWLLPSGVQVKPHTPRLVQWHPVFFTQHLQVGVEKREIVSIVRPSCLPFSHSLTL